MNKEESKIKLKNEKSRPDEVDKFECTTNNKMHSIHSIVSYTIFDEYYAICKYKNDWDQTNSCYKS